MIKLGKMADIDEMMYSCGLKILHPGGIEKTDEMARACKIGKDKKILDIGSGKGVTACYLAKKYGCNVLGIDLSERMIKYGRKIAEKKGLTEKVQFIKLDAHELPFENNTFDIVLAECATVLMDKNKVFSEFIRVTKSGGYVGDLEMIWQKPPTKELVFEVHDVWEGFNTMLLEDWGRLYDKLGLSEIKAVDFSEMIPDMDEAMKKELGLKGMIKMGFKLLLHSDLRKAMNINSKIFKEYSDYIGYGYIIGKRT